MGSEVGKINLFDTMYRSSYYFMDNKIASREFKQRRVPLYELTAVIKGSLGEFIEDPEIEKYFAGIFKRDFYIFQETLNEGRITEEMEQRFSLTKEHMKDIFIKTKRKISYTVPNPENPEQVELFWSNVRATGVDRDVRLLPGLSYKTSKKLAYAGFKTIRELLEYQKNEDPKLKDIGGMGRGPAHEVLEAITNFISHESE